MLTGSRNGQASSCCSNCSSNNLHGANSRCCFLVNDVRLLAPVVPPSLRGEAVGVGASDELMSSTCVLDAVEGVGLRRKTTQNNSYCTSLARIRKDV